MTCPTCDAESELIFDGECTECAEGEAAVALESLQPD